MLLLLLDNVAMHAIVMMVMVLKVQIIVVELLDKSVNAGLRIFLAATL